jgi:glutaredoxin
VTRVATPYAVYWQPGCTSCLRTKELLRSYGIEFESINVRETPRALETLAELGVRSVPVVVRGRDFVLGQDIDEVARFIGIVIERERLARTPLVERTLALLGLAAAYVRQLPDASLTTPLPGRTRTYRDLAYHVPMIAVALIDGACGGCLTFEHYKRKPPERLQSADDSARSVDEVRQALADWWRGGRARVPGQIDTYFGRQPFDVALERTAWHIAQHVRQLEFLVRGQGIEPAPALDPALLAGLPLPRDVWDEELPPPAGASNARAGA